MLLARDCTVRRCCADTKFCQHRPTGSKVQTRQQTETVEPREHHVALLGRNADQRKSVEVFIERHC
jgi:hypothetical protein